MTVYWTSARVTPDAYVARSREVGTTAWTEVVDIQDTTVSIIVPQAGTYEVQVASAYEDEDANEDKNKSRSQWAPATPA